MAQKKTLLVLFSLASLELGSASRINVQHRVETEKSDSSQEELDEASSSGGDICTINEVGAHVQYGIKFQFKISNGKCNRASCNPFLFLDETVGKMISAYPDHGGQKGTCSCYVKEGPTKKAKDHHFLMTYLQFPKDNGKNTFDCNPEMCWERYSMIVTLAMKAEHDGVIDWSRTQDMESRNHWESSSGSSSGAGSVTPEVAMPSAHDIIQKLEENGKDEGITEILEIVNDKEQLSAEEIRDKWAAAAAALKKQVFIDDVDDGKEEKPQHMVAFNDVETELREVVILSPKHGVCSNNAYKYLSNYHPDDVTCRLISKASDCDLAHKMMGVTRSDSFNDMTPPDEEADQYYAQPFKIAALKRYPPGCFGRVTGSKFGAAGPLHVSFNPLTPAKGNKEKRAKKNKGGNVITRLICGCYDKA